MGMLKSYVGGGTTVRVRVTVDALAGTARSVTIVAPPSTPTVTVMVTVPGPLLTGPPVPATGEEGAGVADENRPELGVPGLISDITTRTDSTATPSSPTMATPAILRLVNKPTTALRSPDQQRTILACDTAAAQTSGRPIHAAEAQRGPALFGTVGARATRVRPRRDGHAGITHADAAEHQAVDQIAEERSARRARCHYRSMWIAVGAAIGLAWFLALLLLPVDRLPLLNGSMAIIMGVAVLAVGLLVWTGVLVEPAVSRPPWPIAVLAVASCLMLIYRGVMRLREGRPEREPPTRQPPPSQ
jgi:hypothetical protein